VAEEASFRHSLRIQLRVIGALLMREVITRYGRHNLGVLWLFLEPMVFTLGVLALWVFSGLGKGRDLPVVAFCVTGYSAVLLWRNCAMRASAAIPPNHGLLYHRNVRVLDLLITRILLEIGGASLSFFGLTCFFVWAGLMEWPADLVRVLTGWVLLAWFGTALAILIGAASAFSDLIERLIQPTTYVLFPLSGALFMVDWLPPDMRELILYLPMVSGLELIREGFFGQWVRAHYDIDYMVACCLVLTLFGLALTRKAARRVELPV
jgi:capsular polysaccharide transport system permease protein